MSITKQPPATMLLTQQHLFGSPVVVGNETCSPGCPDLRKRQDFLAEEHENPLLAFEVSTFVHSFCGKLGLIKQVGRMSKDEIQEKDWRQELQDKGYFIFRGLLSDDDIPVIKERVRFIAQHAEAYERLGIGYVKEDQANAADPLHRYFRLNSSAYHNETLWKTMIANPRTIELVRSVLKDDFCVNAGGVFLKPPRHGSVVPWHQDSAAWKMPPAPYDPDEPAMFDFWMAIDRATEANGCLQLIPHSHKLGRIAHGQQGNKLTEADPCDHGYDPEKDAVICEMEAGDILVWHQNALHYSGPNRSDEQRIGLAGTFIANRDVPWMREIRPLNKYLEHLPVCKDGGPLGLPKAFRIDESRVVGMAN